MGLTLKKVEAGANGTTSKQPIRFEQTLIAEFTNFNRMSRESYLFSSLNHLYMFLLNGTRQKFQNHHLGQWRFLIPHWISLSSNWPHAMIVSFSSNVTSFSAIWVLELVFSGFSVCNSTSFSRFHTILSQTLTPGLIHLLCNKISIFKTLF